MEIHETYRGYKIYWTGFKEHVDITRENFPRIGDSLIGQWIGIMVDAAGKAQHNLYVSVPGKEGEFQRGASFDVDPQPGQVEITDSTHLNIKIQECLKGLTRMHVLIDQIGKYDKAA
jgi:hypothetical protein